MKKELPEHIEKLCRKGFYPYAWFDNNEKFNHVGLPCKEAFYSSLSHKHISDDDYRYACSIYEVLGCKSF